MNDLIVNLRKSGVLYTRNTWRFGTGNRDKYEIYEGSADAVLEPSRLQSCGSASIGSLLQRCLYTLSSNTIPVNSRNLADITLLQ